MPLHGKVKKNGKEKGKRIKQGRRHGKQGTEGGPAMDHPCCRKVCIHPPQEQNNKGHRLFD